MNRRSPTRAQQIFSVVLAVVIIAAIAIVAATSGSSHKSSHPSTFATRAPVSQLPKLCPPGESHLGCSIERPPQGFKALHIGLPPGCLIPDDYEGNNVNYAVAKPHICGAIIKAGEGDFHVDHLFATRVTTLRALHIWHAYYWFIRPQNCTAEANLMINTIQSHGGLDSGPLIFDAEVPGAAAMVRCLESHVVAVFHRPAAVYTSPGTWGGSAADAGGLDAWIATFGSRHGCLAWTCHFIAWQFASPPFVSVFIPGMGVGDVSVDQGITKLVPAVKPPPPPPPPPSVFTIFPTLKLKTPQGTNTERQLAEQLDGALQHRAKYASYIKRVLAPEALWFAGRISYLAYHVWPAPHPNWSANKGGSRRAYLVHAAQGHRISH